MTTNFILDFKNETGEQENLIDEEVFVKYPDFPRDTFDFLKRNWRHCLLVKTIQEQVEKTKPGGFDFNPHLTIRHIVKLVVEAMTAHDNEYLVVTNEEVMEIWLMKLYYNQWKIPPEWSEWNV